MGFWHKVEHEREFQNLSRKELALRANISYQGIGLGLERNSMPGADTALRVARALNVSLEYLLDYEESDFPETSLSEDDLLRRNAALYSRHRETIEALEKMPPSVREPIEEMILRVGNRPSGD